METVCKLIGFSSDKTVFNVVDFFIEFLKCYRLKLRNNLAYLWPDWFPEIDVSSENVLVES